MSNEIWKDIKDYEMLYQISNLGNVKSLHCNKEKIMKLTIRSKNYPYYFVGLLKNGKRKYFAVHRLVAQAFIPNPNNLPEVNHKDKNTFNNNVDNLEWCDKPYNNSYSHIQEKLTEKKKKMVYQYDLDNNLIKIWDCVRDCEKYGFAEAAISRCCLGKQQTHKGYKWSYEPL